MEIRAPYILIGGFVLAVIAAAFGFVYWLHNTGSLSERTTYRINFENTVSGLLTGAAVLFNGIRVGEVTALELDAGNPNRVTATIAVAANTPVRADTKVGLDFQGLTGVPVVALQGGSKPLAGATPGQPLTLTADPLAGQSMTTAARDALRRLDLILADNAEPLRTTIANLNTFSAALARNSDKLDSIVNGLDRLTGGSAANAPRVVYDLAAPKTFPSLDKPQSPLIVADPASLLMFETRKILVRPGGNEDPSFAGAEWSDSTPKLVQEKIIQSFENAGLAVARASENVTSDNQLFLDLRKFQLSASATPSAEVEFGAKVTANGRLLGTRVFECSSAPKSANAAATVDALNEAFGKCAIQLVQWTAGLMR
ncbi:MAG TPA: MlaD family protein [Pseudolabrys sp.]|nr:MlaD family protein [Pseudolabrys sp.]